MARAEVLRGLEELRAARERERWRHDHEAERRRREEEERPYVAMAELWRLSRGLGRAPAVVGHFIISAPCRSGDHDMVVGPEHLIVNAELIIDFALFARAEARRMIAERDAAK